jgi:hypothetical protein
MNGKKKMVMFNETEIKKDLFKSKAMAKFSHYIAGNLYYNIEVFGDTYEFPISTVEKVIETDSFEREEIQTLRLSSDLGTTRFESEIRGSELSRWISKAIKAETFIKLG